METLLFAQQGHSLYDIVLALATLATAVVVPFVSVFVAQSLASFEAQRDESRRVLFDLVIARSELLAATGSYLHGLVELNITKLPLPDGEIEKRILRHFLAIEAINANKVLLRSFMPHVSLQLVETVEEIEKKASIVLHHYNNDAFYDQLQALCDRLLEQVQSTLSEIHSQTWISWAWTNIFIRKAPNAGP